MKAYKALNIDMTCRGFKYEIGKKYIEIDEISLCVNGFHACKKCSDIFNYYSFDPKETIIAEVELSGTIIDNGGDKICASEIIIISVIEWGYALENLCNTGNCNTGNMNTGDMNTGDMNTGNSNTGYMNTGDMNTGDRNTGNWNTGKWNTGDRNTGNWNTGYMNTGNMNTGYSNTGNRNTGDRNTGNWNTGNWNTGNRNTGYMNIDEPFVRIFGKETTIEFGSINFPSFLFFDVKTTEWVSEQNMTKAEKKEYTEHETLGGYLKVYSDSYKDCFKESFNKNCNKKQAEQLISLPNFDYKIFEKISGITESMIASKLK